LLRLAGEDLCLPYHCQGRSTLVHSERQEPRRATFKLSYAAQLGRSRSSTPPSHIALAYLAFSSHGQAGPSQVPREFLSVVLLYARSRGSSRTAWTSATQTLSHKAILFLVRAPRTSVLLFNALKSTSLPEHRPRRAVQGV
jgi:hypothetical protein